jgi:mono/diheme cytochrome c family protein
VSRGCPGLVLALAVASGCGAPPKPERHALAEALAADGLGRAEREGRALFAGRCAACHGDEGRGDGPNAYTLDPPPPDLARAATAPDPAAWRRIIEEGSRALARSPLCPPWGRVLSDAEVDALLAHLERLRPGDRAE